MLSVLMKVLARIPPSPLAPTLTSARLSSTSCPRVLEQSTAMRHLRSTLVRNLQSCSRAGIISAVVLGTGVFATAASLHAKEMHSTVAKSGKAGTSLDAVQDDKDNATRGHAGEAPSLMLLPGAAVIPHPSKKDKGGEDAFFACDRGMCIGVADGVGGWAEIGVDPGLYSRELMAFAKQAAEDAPISPDTPQQSLIMAHSNTTARGSSTACILCLHGHKVYASNLGDSGFMLIRNGELAFMSPQQQHEFNFPYQIGSMDSMADSPEAAQRFVIDVEEGDVLVAATDGLFDNVYPDEAAALVSVTKQKGEGPPAVANALAEFAHARAGDPTHLSPFAYSAQQLGYRYFGGKMDDITVVCAYVVRRENKSA